MKRPPAESLNTALWPSVDAKVLSKESRRRYQQRVSAIQDYVRGQPLDDIEHKTQLGRRTLYRLIERALKAHPDGRPWGFRALIPGIQIKSYERQKPTKGKRTGLAGAFRQLIDRHGELERFVRQQIQSQSVLLTQKGDRFYLNGLKNAHGQFIRLCRTIGLTVKDYPLNQDDQGLRSLSQVFRDRMLDGFGQATHSAGGVRVKPDAALAFTPERAISDPFDCVEFDAHKLDLRLKILDQDPYGEEQLLEIERVWLLAIIDVATRAILGYSLCLRREYNRYDVIRTFERALIPAQPVKTTIPDLEPMSEGGFVSLSLPETAYACWQQIRFDNARAHLAADSLDVACELLGCTVDVGPAYEPDDRPFIERFFGTVVTRLAHRLPGTTGSNPRDILRRLSKSDIDLQLVVGLDELQELLAVWVWNYNGSPHGGLGGRTPLEAMRRAVRDRGLLLRPLPEPLRHNLCLLQNAYRAHVRGNISRGEKPHISFYHVRYTSAMLAQSPRLIGKHIQIYYDADDIRTLRAFLDDGTELGELKAGGLWRMTPHSLNLRQRIFKAKRLRQIRVGEFDDPVEVYLKFKRTLAKRSRKAASEIAHIKQSIQAENAASPDATAAPTESLPLAVGPVKARRLRIPSGFAR